MSIPHALPTLDFYAREGCELCTEARVDLQAALEARVLNGDPIASVRMIDIDGQPELETRYGALLPVLALAGHELTLVMGRRTIDAFLDRVLGRSA